MVKLKKHHRDKYGRRIGDWFNQNKLSKHDRDIWINTIKKYLMDNGMTEFEKDGLVYKLSDEGVEVTAVDKTYKEGETDVE